MIVYCDIRKNYMVYNEVTLMNNIKEDKKMDQNTVQQNVSVESNTTVAQFQGLKTRSASLSAAQLSSLLNTSNQFFIE